MYTPYADAAGMLYQLREIYTPYAGAAGMLLHINVKLTTNFNLCLVAFTIPLTVLTH
jgi:hypothetical protein